MNLSRRSFIVHSAGAAAAVFGFPGMARPSASGIRFGSCMLDLAQAKEAGLEGVEVRCGAAADVLEIALPEKQADYKAQMAATGLPIASIMMGILNQFPLATDPRGPAWLDQCIDAAKDLSAKVVLVAFFGKGNLLDGDKLKESEFAEAARRIKAAAPRAKDAGVTLALENLLSAEQNERMLDLIGHESVRVYYDVYNTGKTQGYDSPAEIRRLGGRIAQIHYKNGKEYLDDDKPFFEAVSAAVKDIGYKGWIVLETQSPSKDPVADGRRNGQYAMSLFA